MPISLEGIIHDFEIEFKETQDLKDFSERILRVLKRLCSDLSDSSHMKKLFTIEQSRKSGELVYNIHEGANGLTSITIGICVADLIRTFASYIDGDKNEILNTVCNEINNPTSDLKEERFN